MKIIGKTGKGYLVEATGDELAYCVGASSEWSLWYDINRNSQHSMASAMERERFCIGAEINITAGFKYLGQLRDNESKVRGSGAILRAMADMVEGALPTTLIPPQGNEAISES